MILRFQLPHQALAVLYGVDRATITRAIHEIRPLLAGRGFTVPGQPGLRLGSLAEVFASAAAEGIQLRLDVTQTQVRRPRANRAGRRAFVSGKSKQNTHQDHHLSDGHGRTLWAGRCAGPHARPDHRQDRGHPGPAGPAPHRHGHR